MKEKWTYQVWKKMKVVSNRPALLTWVTVSKSTWNKYPENKRRIKEWAE
jgi:hypothetical protein